MRFAVLFIALASSAPGAFQVVNAGVRQIEDGPAVGESLAFVPGETVYYSFQLAGYGTAPAGPQTRKVKFSYTIHAFDPRGVALAEPVESVLDTTITDLDKEWKPKVRHEIAIPSYAPPGRYKISVKVSDDIAVQPAAAETFFEVSGRAVEHSPELTIRNFAFYRSEEEAKGMEVPAYRPGDNLFARFDITGFRYADHNAIEVSYDVAVSNAAGKVIYTQAAAAAEKSFSFYPKPYVPGGMSLSLQSNMAKGDYAVLLTAHDAVGHQTFELRQVFQVE